MKEKKVQFPVLSRFSEQLVPRCSSELKEGEKRMPHYIHSFNGHAASEMTAIFYDDIWTAKTVYPIILVFIRADGSIWLTSQLEPQSLFSPSHSHLQVSVDKSNLPGRPLLYVRHVVVVHRQKDRQTDRQAATILTGWSKQIEYKPVQPEREGRMKKERETEQRS